MYENGSIQRSNIRTYGLVLESAKLLICNLHTQYYSPIIVLGVECTKMVAFNTLTSGHINLCLNHLNKLICDLHELYPLPLILLVVWMYENGSIQHSNIRTYNLVLKSAKKTHLWSSCTIFPTNNTVGRWKYENGSIQHYNIRTYKVCLNQLKKLICDLHAQYPLPLILLGVECT